MCYVFQRLLSDFNVYHKLGVAPTSGKFYGAVTWRDDVGALGGGRTSDRKIPLHEIFYSDLRLNNSTWVVAIEVEAPGKDGQETIADGTRETGKES